MLEQAASEDTVGGEDESEHMLEQAACAKTYYDRVVDDQAAIGKGNHSVLGYHLPLAD
jgi:hypothetical protein